MSSSAIRWTRHRLSLRKRRRIRYPKEPWVSKELAEAVDQLETSFASTRVSSSVYASLLRRCSKELAFSYGVRVHNHMSSTRYLRSTFINNLLIRFYGKCGDVDWARDVFEITPKRNVFTWNAMMRLLEENSNSRRVFRMFWRMRTEGLPDATSYSIVARACGRLRMLKEGSLIHDELMKRRIPEDHQLQSSLIFMYGKCGRFDVALQLFRDAGAREADVWNAIIIAACKHRELQLALKLTREMLQEGSQPDKITFWITLELHLMIGDLIGARGIAERVVSSGLDQLYSKKLQQALIRVHCELLQFDRARALLERLPLCNKLAWSSSIRTYVKLGCSDQALELFHAMRARCCNPDSETFVAVLGACCGPEYLKQGKAIFARMIATMAPRGELVSALIKMFSECGSLRDSKMIFDRWKTTRRSHWNSMLEAYRLHARHQDCIDLFKATQAEGVRLNDSTYRIIFSACSGAENRSFGNWLLSILAVNRRALTPSMQRDALGFFAAHGDVENAEKAFLRMSSGRDESSWKSLAMVYGVAGRALELTRFVSFMELEGISPEYEKLVGKCMSADNLSPGFFHQFIETFELGCWAPKLHAS